MRGPRAPWDRLAPDPKLPWLWPGAVLFCWDGPGGTGRKVLSQEGDPPGDLPLMEGVREVGVASRGQNPQP